MSTPAATASGTRRCLAVLAPLRDRPPHGFRRGLPHRRAPLPPCGLAAPYRLAGGHGFLAGRRGLASELAAHTLGAGGGLRPAPGLSCSSPARTARLPWPVPGPSRLPWRPAARPSRRAARGSARSPASAPADVIGRRRSAPACAALSAVRYRRLRYPVTGPPSRVVSASAACRPAGFLARPLVVIAAPFP